MTADRVERGPWAPCFNSDRAVRRRDFPAIRLVAGIAGPLGLLPSSDLLWLLSMASIPGTLVWCLVLGMVLVRRGYAPSLAHRLDPVAAEGT